MLLTWIMCLTLSYLSNIIVCPSLLKYSALLPVDLSIFVNGHMLQTPTCIHYAKHLNFQILIANTIVHSGPDSKMPGAIMEGLRKTNINSAKHLHAPPQGEKLLIKMLSQYGIKQTTVPLSLGPF